jgi:hypothetical protein
VNVKERKKFRFFRKWYANVHMEDFAATNYLKALKIGKACEI